MALILKKKGNFLEDFKVDSMLRHKVGRTLTEGLFNAFTEFSMTTNPLSKNLRYAERYGFPGMIAPPGLVMALVFSQSVEDISENARANLEYIDVRFGVPVYIGDTIEAESLVLGVRLSSSNPQLGVVHVQTTGRNQRGEVVLTYQRKVQVWRGSAAAEVVEANATTIPTIECQPWLPPYRPEAKYADLAHLTNADTYFEDFVAGDTLEHWRGRVMTSEHIALTAMLDNTSQVHCNQHMIDQEPEKYLGGKLIIFGGIPFNLCLGLSCPDVADNALADIAYTTGRHTAPIFAGDTVFATTEIRGKRDLDGRTDLGVLATTLRGHKFVAHEEGYKKVEIFYLEREIAVKRRSHYV